MKKLFYGISLIVLALCIGLLPNFCSAENVYAENASISIENEQSSYILNSELEITLECSLPLETQNITWLILKPNETTFTTPILNSITEEELATEIKTTLVFKPSLYSNSQGTYGFVVKYTNDGEKFSDVKFVKVNLEEIADLENVSIQYFQIKNSKSSLQAYKFQIYGLGEYANTYQIEWWVGSSLRAYGSVFIFEPDYPGEFTVSARIGNIDTLHKTVSSSVVNTELQIILLSSILGVLIIALVIGIVINRKSERIW